MSEPTLRHHLMDLRLHVNLDAADFVLGLSTGKIGEFQESYAALRQTLRAERADGQRALDRDSQQRTTGNSATAPHKHVERSGTQLTIFAKLACALARTSAIPALS